MKLIPRILVELNDMQPMLVDVDQAMKAGRMDPDGQSGSEVRRLIAVGIQRIADQAFERGVEYGRGGAQLDDPE